jgi:anion-transporting  ArsA/GET3 family ATPase
MLAAPVPLLNREMLFVTGKGGVGKSTVAAALAVKAAREGRRTIVCELGGQARFPALMGAEPGAPGDEVQVGDRLWATTIESHRVMEEWIARILGSKSLTSLLVRSNFFRAFSEAAPGGRELGEIVKAWELVEGHRWDRRRRGYDLVIVDGPASGHAIGLLRTPGTFADIARVGPIASQSRQVRAWLGDPAKTGFLVVTLPGELPVTETLQIGERLQQSIGRRVEAIVVNGVLPDRFDAAEEDAVEAAAPKGSEAGVVVASARARAGSQAEQIARLRAGTSARVATLPFLFTPELSRRDVEALADLLPVA